jgi:fluoroacetyl-CoA thioesterase
VTARAEVVAVNDRLVTFNVEAHDSVEKIGEGTHVRAAIQLEKFEKKVKQKGNGEKKD